MKIEHTERAGGRRGAKGRRVGPSLIVPLVLLVAVALALGACGGGSSNPASSASSTSPGKPKALKYSQCMRAHGVTNFPDLSGSGGLRIPQSSGININSPTYKAAQQACSKYAPGATATPAQKSQREANALKFARCMRSHGVLNYPDPSTSPSGGPLFPPPTSLGIDTSSPTFQAAQKACRSLLGHGQGQSGS